MYCRRAHRRSKSRGMVGPRQSRQRRVMLGIGSMYPYQDIADSFGVAIFGSDRNSQTLLSIDHNSRKPVDLRVAVACP